MNIRVAALLAGLCVAFPVVAGDKPAPPPQVYVQVWLGGLRTESDSWKITDPQSGEDVLGDLGTLPFGGGAGQKMWGSGAWQIGFEGGGLGTWKSDRTELRGTSGTLQVSIDNEFVSFGVFMGGVVSVTPVRPLRLYVAAGPSVTWAWLHNNNDNQTDNNTLNVSGDANDVSATAYARAGIDVVMGDGFMFGVSVRYADDEFQFGDAGDLKFNQPLWLLTLGSRL